MCDRLTPLEREAEELLLNTRTQNRLARKFREYPRATLAAGLAGMLFPFLLSLGLTRVDAAAHILRFLQDTKSGGEGKPGKHRKAPMFTVVIRCKWCKAYPGCVDGRWIESDWYCSGNCQQNDWRWQYDH